MPRRNFPMMVQRMLPTNSAAHLLREPFRIDSGISARGKVIALEVRSTVASEAALHFHRRVGARHATGGIANKHAKSLNIGVSIKIMSSSRILEDLQA